MRQNQVLNENELFPRKPSKSQQTKLRILEAAIHSYVKFGIERTTYEKLAELTGVTRPLIMRYFPDKNEIFKLAMQYIRTEMQQSAVGAIAFAGPSNEKRIEAYVHSTFDWLEKKPKHARVWLLFYYYCGIRAEQLAVNSALVEAGHARITSLLEAGKKEGVFHARDSKGAAKAIQIQITGALLALLTEKFNDAGAKKLRADTVKRCLEMAHR